MSEDVSVAGLKREDWPRQTCDIPVEIIPQMMAPAIYIRCRREWGHTGKCNRTGSDEQ